MRTLILVLLFASCWAESQFLEPVHAHPSYAELRAHVGVDLMKTYTVVYDRSGAERPPGCTPSGGKLLLIHDDAVLLGWIEINATPATGGFSGLKLKGAERDARTVGVFACEDWVRILQWDITKIPRTTE
ncbi:MAG: hypothetical protein PF961_19880 [Planctomycetota bacterium]|jgi:hypothetical protein|nr:hypothetical protein [Planctomycetota bacterium]